MPNRNYVKGANFEREVKKFYEGLGYLVFRTAGSHSPADLIAFPPLSKIEEWNPILIQCKAVKHKPKEWVEAKELSVIAQIYGLRAVMAMKEKGTKISLTWIVKE